jgi:hypothetical protein
MDSGNTPNLRPEDLYGRRFTRDSARLKAYNQILGQIHHRIRAVSTLPNNPPTNVLYTIPGFILGLPKIDLEDCVVYLVYQLRTQGFEVKYTYPNLLNISWSHFERNYLVEQSPILKAMIDAKEIANNATRTSEKKFKKIGSIMQTGSGAQQNILVEGLSGNELAQQQQQQQQQQQKKRGRQPSNYSQSKTVTFSPSPAAVATVLSAKDYVPPTSFMENLEKPRA